MAPMALETSISSLLPYGWTLSNLISLDDGWQANICDGEFVVAATGDSIEDALTHAASKTLDSRHYLGRLFHLPRLAEPTPGPSTLLSALGLAKPHHPELRRRV